MQAKTSVQKAIYISSCDNPSAANALAATYAHWGIENELQGVLDVEFREGACRAWVKNATENFAVIRHIGINSIKSVPTGPHGKKISIKVKRRATVIREDYFHSVLGLTD